MSLGVKYIIPSRLNFVNVLRKPDIFFQSGHFLFYGKKNKGLNPRLGVSIKKKHYKLAVERNSIKRKIKNSFRKVAIDLPCLDCVVVVKEKNTSVDENQNLELLWRKCLEKKL